MRAESAARRTGRAAFRRAASRVQAIIDALSRRAWAAGGRAARVTIADSEGPFRAIFERSAVGLALLESGSNIVAANAALEAFLGFGRGGLRGRRLRDFAVQDDAGIVGSIVADVGTGTRKSGTSELRFVQRDGGMAWGALTVSPASDDWSRGLIAVLLDVTERKRLEAALVHQAFHDPLTELANRALFRDRVEHALSRTSRRPGRIAALILDLDNFKAANDTEGHAAGDRILQQVAGLLLNATRGCDTVARLGGDEFGVLLEDREPEEGAQVVAQRMIGALRRPVQLPGGRTMSVSASIGIAVHEEGQTSDELLRNADLAMYEAKFNDPGRWVVFDQEMHAALTERVTLEADLRRALERCQLADRPRLANTGTFPSLESRGAPQTEFTVAYQPIVDLRSGRITGVEALARWTHPERGPIPPDVFIPVAQRSGLIFILGRWLLSVACRQTAVWNARRKRDPLTLAVNLSGQQFDHEGLPAEIDAALREAGLPSECLVLEITETVIMQNAEATLALLRELKQRGMRVAIDDFGTGYSSLSYLQQFPVDVVKIDRTFTEGLRHGVSGTALVRTIIALAKTLSLRTIAEGVEDHVQLDRLRELGCDAAQGYLFGHPVAAEDIGPLLAARPRNRLRRP